MASYHSIFDPRRWVRSDSTDTDVLNSVPDGALSSNVALLNRVGQTFTTTQNLGTSIANLGTAATAFGDSITVGNGATTPSTGGYAALVAAQMRWTLTNSAVASTQLSDAGQMDAIYGVTPAAGSNYFLLTGFNDMRVFGAVAAGVTTYGDALYSALSFLAVPQASKITSASSAVAYVGVWTASAHGGKFTATNGNTATFTMQGPTLYIVSERVTGQTGTFTVTVDGVVIATYNCFGNLTTALTRNFSPFLIRITGLHTGKHTVVITKTGGDFIYFDWAAFPGLSVEGAPNVWVGNCLRMNATGYAIGGPTYNNGSDVIVRQYNLIISNAVIDLAGDGLNVALVDAASSYDPDTSDVNADNIHPSDTGHAKIAAVFEAEMNGLVDSRNRLTRGEFVTTSTAQTVGGVKTFSTPFFITGTGGASRYLRQNTASGVIDVVQPVTTDLSDWTPWTAFTPSLTAGTGTWTAGTTQVARYMIIGKKMTVEFYLTGNSNSNITTTLKVAIPASKVAAQNQALGPVSALDNSVVTVGFARTSAAGTTIDIFKDIGATTNWAISAATNSMGFTATIEIQ